jgi:hypothetical protein
VGQIMELIRLSDDKFVVFSEVNPSATRQTIGPPPDSENILPASVVTIFDEDGPKICTFWQPDEDDLACLNRGGMVQFSWMGDHLHPISSQVWG